VGQRLKITVSSSIEELLQLRPIWESLYSTGKYTIFQDFWLNLLAAQRFAGREQPYVVCAETSNGVAIVPAVVRHRDQSIRLLGEELFDYRCFLCDGEEEALRVALATLASLQHPMEVVAMRERDRAAIADELDWLPFASAPAARSREISAEQFTVKHTRLARNLRRLERLGLELRTFDGDNPQLLRSIYNGKAEQLESSLFHDPARVEFLVEAAALLPQTFETFTLEGDSEVKAAVVTLLDGDTRRFYTGWFSPEYEKHSPALSLIYEVTQLSLAQGLNCDYMTGEQPYKLRLATSSAPLFRVRASVKQLSRLGDESKQTLRAVG
jgi:CelD/BcsL family acetyltransferase involved in cellulose biosynthesis